MNEYATSFLARELSQEIARNANNPRRLMEHELRTANRAQRRRRRSRS
jgi:hypothetical protein